MNNFERDVTLGVVPHERYPRTSDVHSSVAPGAVVSDHRPTPSNGHPTTTSDPGVSNAKALPYPQSFVVVDLDSDTWRMYDGMQIRRIPSAMVLACDVEAEWLVVEGCHVVPQGNFSVSAPFTLAQLQRMAANAAARDIQVRTLPNRRIARAWAEEFKRVPGDWDTRPKGRDSEVWYRWLEMNPARLISLKRWTPGFPAPTNRVKALNTAVMRDANMVRQFGRYRETEIAQAFAVRVSNTIDNMLNSDFAGSGDLIALLKTLRCERHPSGRARYHWPVLDSPYVRDAYCVARDASTGRPRPDLSINLVRKACGLSANGFPNLIRSNLRLHGKDLGKPTTVDKWFVTLVMKFNREGGD